jgi:hypothetical protein
MKMTQNILRLCMVAIIQAAFAQADPCRDETQKAENFYEICIRFDPQSPGYMDCVKMYMEQRAKTIDVCKANPPAPVAAPLAPQAQEPASAAALVSATAKSVSQALRESSLPGGCVGDFTSLLETDGFSMGKFVKDLPVAVAKVKLQMKSPFGKPKDGDKTSVGLTVGCIKSLPESPAEIQGLLKDIALKAGLSFAADAVASVADGSDGEPREEGSDKKGVRFGIRAGANVAGANTFYDMNRNMIDDGYGLNGYGFGAGLTLNAPLARYLKFNMGLDFYYRYLRMYDWGIVDFYMKEFTVSIPVLLHLGGSFYFAAGARLDIPIKTNSYIDDDYSFTTTNRIDFGLVLGLGYMITSSFGIDFNFVTNLTTQEFEIHKNRYSYYSDYSLMQLGLGMSYFF